MAKVLYITGNPKSDETSMSLSVGAEFLKAYRKQNPNDEVIQLDLYKDYIPLIDAEVFSGWGRLSENQELLEGEQKKVYQINSLVDQFVEVDKYIFVTPMWNLSVPPMVRAYVDCIMMAGKTFRYTEAGPEGLLKGKKAVHIQARGGFYSEGPGSEIEMGDKYLRAILNFMGVENVQSVIIEGHAFDPSKAPEIKNNAIDQAINVANEF